jgi:hypothetical protein
VPVPRSKQPLPQVQISDPAVHRNLSVFFLTPPQEASSTRFATLDDGLRWVALSEQRRAQVQQLTIDNRGARPLFLHEGQRLRGGRQDRTTQTTLVVPARSGPRALPAFCIERTRWNGGGGFRGAGERALAPRAVRVAAKVLRDQGSVWARVDAAKSVAHRQLDAANTTSSLNELYRSPQVQRALELYAGALRGAIEGHPHAAGVAFAIGGRVEEASVYANPALLAKVYPGLLAGYALEAVLAGGGFADAPAAETVRRFWRRGRAKSREHRALDDVNELTVARYGETVECVSRFAGEVVHQQLIRF